MMKILCIIPARLHSTRLDKKPLALLKDKPMIQWVYEAAVSCKDLDKVIVATDSQEIVNIIENIGGQAEMTPSDLNTGSDRVAYVAKKYKNYDVIVNLQGDEPFVTADMLSALVKPFVQGESLPMTTLAAPFEMEQDYRDPNSVKVIYDQNFDALYFSRSPIPFFRNQDYKPFASESTVIKGLQKSFPLALHLGLYAYERDFLLKYTKLPQTPLEQFELLEQLRALENGYKIRVCFTDKRILEINTPEDLEKARLCT